MLFDRYAARVQDAWLDYNGHLNEGYYTVAFSHASDLWMDAVGLDAAGRAAHRATIYTVEAHIAYLNEVARGATIRVATQLLGVDAKRAYAFNVMRVDDDPAPVATHEALYVCVSTETRRVAAWPAPVRAALDALAAEHAAQPTPDGAGRALGPHRLKP